MRRPALRFCNPRIRCGKEKLSFTKDCMELKNEFSPRKNAVPRIRPGFIVTRYSSCNPVCSSVPPHHDRLHLQRLLRLMPNECFKRCAIPNHRRRRLIYNYQAMKRSLFIARVFGAFKWICGQK